MEGIEIMTKHGKILCCAAVVSMMSLIGGSCVWAESALTVPPGAHAMIDEALATLAEKKQREEEKRYREEAEAFVLSTEDEVLRAARELEAARTALLGAQEEARIAEEQRELAVREAAVAAQYAELLNKRAKSKMVMANVSTKQAEKMSLEAQQMDAMLRSYLEEAAAATTPEEDKRSLEYADELRRLEAEQKRLEDYLKAMEEARQSGQPIVMATPSGADWDEVNKAYERASTMEKAAILADRRSEHALKIAGEKETVASDAIVRADDAKAVLQDAKLTVATYESYLEEARISAAQATTDRDQLAHDLDNPSGSYFGSAGAKYHHWDGGWRGSGYQTVLPITAGYWHPKYSYSLSTQYVLSDYLDTFTDTTLYLSARDEREKFTLDYSLAFNIPTGKSALNASERRSRITEDLVSVEQFGKGWQVTPGVAISWNTSEYEKWTVGTTYTFSESYDPTSDLPNDDISPGGEWGKFLRYQNARDEWQLVMELMHTSYGSTDVDNGSSYREDDSWLYRMAYNKVLSPTQSLMFYYWLERQSQQSVPFETDDAYVHYFGTMWKKKLTPQSDLRVMFDVMTTDGRRYMGLYDTAGGYAAEEVDGRTKYTVGIGYDYRFNENSWLNFDVHYFHMRDGTSTAGYPSATYDGWNVYLVYYIVF